MPRRRSRLLRTASALDELRRGTGRRTEGGAGAEAGLLPALLLVGIPSLAVADNWPQWRGPKNDGLSGEKGLPTEWGPEKNVVWKLPLPGQGESTPCVWGDSIFFSCTAGDDVVLMCVGTEDPFIPLEARLAFEQDMKDAGVADWNLEVYGGVGHSFTNTLADTAGMPGLAYHQPSDERSWTSMLRLFGETIGTP